MLLILTNSRDATADYLASILDRNEVGYLRFNTDTSLVGLDFAYDSSGPRFYLDGNWHTPSRFTNVWYRRPERVQHSDIPDTAEGRFTLEEWSEALEGFFSQIPKHAWMNHPACNVAASRKIHQLQVAQQLGLLVPDTIVTLDPNVLRPFFARHVSRVIAKPMGRGYVERSEEDVDSLVYTNVVLEEHLSSLDDLHASPTLFQEYVEKTSDVRVTVVDQNMYAVELTAHDEDGTQRCDIRRNNMEDVHYERIAIPSEVGGTLRLFIDHFGLRFAAVDMVVSKDGRWFFLEINPNGQWAWLDTSGGMDIAGLFVESFGSRD